MRGLWLLGLLVSASAATPDLPAPVPVVAPVVLGHVVSVYDGDTLTLSNGDKIRLKWANAPELKAAEPFAVESRDATRALVQDRDITLTIDAAAARDSYGRVLAAVSVDGKDLSLHLVELGLAHVYMVPPVDGDPAPYLAAQAKAQAAKLGIWSNARFAGPLHITSFHANAPGDESLDPNLEYLRVCNISNDPVLLSAYRITDAQGNVFALPKISLPPGYTVKIHSGKGADDTDVGAQITAHLGSDVPIWNNTYDKAVILDADGRVVDSVEYHGKS